MPDIRLPATYHQRPRHLKYGRGPNSGVWYDSVAARLELSRVRTPEEHGAVGDGVTDDTAALQALRVAAQSGDVLYFAPGKVYRFAEAAVHYHWVNKNGLTIIGRNSRIHATVPAESGMQFENCHDLWIEGLTLSTDLSGLPLPGNAGSRGSSYHHQRFTIYNCDNFTGIDMRISGSYAGGIFVAAGSENWYFERPVIRNTRADGFHVSSGSKYGEVLHPQLHNVGDDGFAVVSYNADLATCSNITVDGCRVGGQYHGRGMTVVGGSDIEYRNFEITSSRAAGLYIGVESGSYVTKSVERVVATGGKLIGCSQAGSVEGHPAVLVFNSATDGRITNDVEVSYVTIEDVPGPKVPCRIDGSAAGQCTNVKLFGNHILGQFSATAPTNYSMVDGWIAKHSTQPTPTLTGTGSSNGVFNIPNNRVRAY